MMSKNSYNGSKVFVFKIKKQGKLNRTSAHDQDKVTWSIFPPDTPKKQNSGLPGTRHQAMIMTNIK